MAVRNPERKAKSFEVGVEDEMLLEVLSAKKTDITLKHNGNGSEGSDNAEGNGMSDINNHSGENGSSGGSGNFGGNGNSGGNGNIGGNGNSGASHEGGNGDVISYEDVRARTVSYARDHEDAKTRRENKKKSRRLTGRRLFETILSIGLVILIGFFVMLLLYPQTELSELARDNSNLKDQINTAKREIVNAEENANGIADMDVIRAQALALGMQDPNQNQVINLPIPNTDSLRTRMTYNTDGINDDAFNDSKDALADYYAAHPGK